MLLSRNLSNPGIFQGPFVEFYRNFQDLSADFSLGLSRNSSQKRASRDFYRLLPIFFRSFALPKMDFSMDYFGFVFQRLLPEYYNDFLAELFWDLLSHRYFSVILPDFAWKYFKDSCQIFSSDFGKKNPGIFTRTYYGKFTRIASGIVSRFFSMNFSWVIFYIFSRVFSLNSFRDY